MFAKFHSRALFGFLVTHLMLLANQLLIYGRPALIHSFTRASPIRRAFGSFAQARKRSFSSESSGEKSVGPEPEGGSGTSSPREHHPRWPGDMLMGGWLPERLTTDRPEGLGS